MTRRTIMSTVRGALAAVIMVALGLLALPTVSQAQTVPAKTKPVPKFYLSLGDSYSVGYQPGIGATAGYTAYVAKRTKTTLENFGCGGATTTSILTVIGCGSGYGPPALTDAVAYPTETQEQAAVDFIDANPGQIGLITVSIGGNDVTACGSNPDPTSCVEAADTTIQTNVTSLVDTLDNALDHQRGHRSDRRPHLSRRDLGRLCVPCRRHRRCPGQRVHRCLRRSDQPDT